MQQFGESSWQMRRSHYTSLATGFRLSISESNVQGYDRDNQFPKSNTIKFYSL